MPLGQQELQSAIEYNRVHASDLLPGLRAKLGLTAEDFIPAMIEAIVVLQKEHDIKPLDGKIGGETRKAIVDDLPLHDATSMWPASGVDARAHWLALAKARGASEPTSRSLLIGLRGLAVEATKTHALASRAKYDDTFVWLGVDGSVRVFAGATHPYQAAIQGNLGADVDGDGRKDVATIKPGYYHFVPAKHLHHGTKALGLRTQDEKEQIPCWRDVDHDRTIGARDLDDVAGGILLHPGYDTAHGSDASKRFSSVGCQTATGSDVAWLCNHAPFDYLLIDVNEHLTHQGNKHTPTSS